MIGGMAGRAKLLIATLERSKNARKPRLGGGHQSEKAEAVAMS
jgi:hypothetical protein